jgi:hypothetical protein
MMVIKKKLYCLQSTGSTVLPVIKKSLELTNISFQSHFTEIHIFQRRAFKGETQSPQENCGALGRQQPHVPTKGGHCGPIPATFPSQHLPVVHQVPQADA